MGVFSPKMSCDIHRLTAFALTNFIIFFFFSQASAQNVPIYTSPIEITGGHLSITAFAPDRNSGAMVSLPVPPGTFGPRMTALTSVPINVLMDGRWNGTPDQVAAGTSPRQQACDGPSGVRAQVMQQASAAGTPAYNISCNFGTTGRVFVKQVGSALYLSYQVLNNTVNFRTTTPVTCHPDHGSLFCPNDPSFEVRFAFELLTVIWTTSLCTIQAGPPDTNLHGVQIESHNLVADIVQFVDSAFLSGRFLAAELAMEARETRAPITIDDAFNELRSSAACAGSDVKARIFQTFSQLDTNINLPQGIELRATHPPIPAPRIQNISLPYGEDTCVQGYVWREAYPGDHVCVTPQSRTQAANDNAEANSRRSPNGGPYGPNTCVQSYVWREARIGDLVCVSVEARSQTAADNAAADSRRVLQPSSVPTFTRTSITAPPVVPAGASFELSGQFFPPTLDPTSIHIFIDRDSNAACFGGGTELETVRTGIASMSILLPMTSGSMSSCNYKYEARGLQTSAKYRFRARDCDAITCSAWSNTFETMIEVPRTTWAQLTLDNGVNLGSTATSGTGTFQANVTMPANTTIGTHKLTGASGLASASIDVQVTNTKAAASIIITGAFYGDRGCPVRPAPNTIVAAGSFTLFGWGFLPGTVNIRLDSTEGEVLGAATAQTDGTFCAYFNGPPLSVTGAHNLIAIQNDTVRTTLAVNVITKTHIR
ncbi:MAG: hypothetical protein JSR20_00950 [Nitrospira sp.]|nr:hypothetical protein [Nitrospira sp.]